MHNKLMLRGQQLDNRSYRAIASRGLMKVNF